MPSAETLHHKPQTLKPKNYGVWGDVWGKHSSRTVPQAELQSAYLALAARRPGSLLRLEELKGLRSTSTLKVCKIMAFRASIMGLGLLAYIVLGFR